MDCRIINTNSSRIFIFIAIPAMIGVTGKDLFEFDYSIMTKALWISLIVGFTSGEITIKDKNPLKLKGDELALFRRRELGFVFQDFNLLDTLTVGENIVLPITLDGVPAKEQDEQLNRILKILGIENLINKRTFEISVVIPDGGKDEVTILKEDIYNKLAVTLSVNTVTLKENETMLASYLDKNKTENIILDGTEFRIVGSSDSGVIPVLYDNVYVLKDDVYKKIKGEKCYFGAFNVNEYKDTLSIGNNYYNKFGDDKGDKYYNNFLKAYILESTKIAYGVILFSAVFIGLIFFVTTASFLYNKCYMDLMEDKNKYKQLYKIGLTYSEIKKVLNIEIGELFLLPYIIAVIHFCFAISALNAFGIAITVPALQIIAIMLIVQIIYFLIIRKNYLLEIKRSLL